MTITHARIRLGKQMTLILARLLLDGYGTLITMSACAHTRARSGSLGRVYR